jgi:hypothetical protein
MLVHSKKHCDFSISNLKTTKLTNMNKTTFQGIRNINERSASLLLLLLFCADFGFIVVSCIHKLTPLINDELFSIGRDRGYAEIFQYIKWFWIIVLFSYLTIARRSFSYVAWGVTFLYLLCDDSLGIHEKIGRLISGNLGFEPPFGMYPRDIGELAVSALAGITLTPLLIWAYLRGSPAFKNMSQDLLLLILVLAFFGVAVDTVHSIVRGLGLGSKAEFILGLIEDGGEMLIASLMVWYVFLLSIRDDICTSFLFDSVRLLLKRPSA